MRTLTIEDVLKGYDAVSGLYPHVPSLSLWRAWEYAAYQAYELAEPVLDVGCGDGQFFHFLWPRILDVVGVDADLNIANAARQSGVYRAVLDVPCDQLGISEESFGSAFANCSLEHMDHLDDVLGSICARIRPHGPFMLSVVTDKLRTWTSIPLLLSNFCEPGFAEAVESQYRNYHHYVNPFSPEVWREQMEHAGFEIIEHVPILPEITTRLFLFIDQLWHAPNNEGSGEIGGLLQAYFAEVPNFVEGFRKILSGVLRMEKDWSLGSGAVFLARKKQR